MMVESMFKFVIMSIVTTLAISGESVHGVVSPYSLVNFDKWSFFQAFVGQFKTEILFNP